MFTIISRYAFRNIIRTPLRSFFTLFSVALIIMLYTVLTSVGDSFTKQISTVIEQEGIDIVLQAKYAASPVSSIIDDTIVDDIMHFEGIHSYESMLIGRKRLYGKSSVFILGVSNLTVFAQHLGMNIIRGHALGDSTREIVVGEKMAKAYSLSVGNRIQLSSTKKYLIVGVYSSWLNFLNSGVVMGLEEAQHLMGKPNKSSLLFLTLDDTTRTAEIIHKINEQFPSIRAIESQQLPNHIGSIKNIFYFSKIVSMMTLFIAIAVLLNTFIMAISERTREIGILSAMGWSRLMIISIFLMESLLLSFGGGIIGYLCSYPAMTVLLNKFASTSMYIPETPSLDIFFNVLLMSLSIGLFSALFPALYGTKINIAKAIRHE